MTDRNVQTQDARGFTVQIRVAGQPTIMGTGLAVSASHVVTCCHVVQDAGADPYQTTDAEVGVYFPQAQAGDQKEFRAKVCAHFDRYDDDIVVLELRNGQAPIGPERWARLGRARAAEGHKFKSFGYRKLAQYQGLPAFGMIVGQCECPEDTALQCEPLMLDSKHIDAGMSGAGVLDTEDNLVVGLIAATWDTLGHHDRDTNFGVDAAVLDFEPLNRFGIRLYDDPLPKTAAPTPPDLPDPRMALLRPAHPAAWNGAPPLLDEWVGRADLLRALTADWEDDATRITTLVGFGGEGKSSLARQWVAHVQNPQSKIQHRATAIFWWSFYDDASVDTFAEALLAYLSGGKIDTRDVPSTTLKLELCARLLQGGRVLLVLDGFEVMQHQGGEGAEGDRYGLLRSSELRRFLEYLAAPESAAFCLITSRAPVLDLLPFTTCTQRDVTRLSPADGRALLRAVGARGTDAALDAVVRAWDGHALTLSLLGSLLAERHGGDLAHLDELPPPTADETRYARVHRILRRYDDHLTPAERDLLKRFSLFRTPVKADAFARIRVGEGEGEGERGREGEREHELPPRTPSPPHLLPRLLTYRLLRHNPHDDTYTTHPLIRAHYFALFTRGEPDASQAAHARIKDYYLALAGDTPHVPTLDDLKPLIEVVHHACRARAYGDAWNIYWQRISQRNRSVIVRQLGAYETDLSTIVEFFPKDDDGSPNLNAAPQVSGAVQRRWILNAMGFRLMNLGRLQEAVPFYERAVQGYLEAKEWSFASRGYQNLAQLHIYLGDPSTSSGQAPSTSSGQGFAAGAEAAREALALARRAANKQYECYALAWLAWIEHLRGARDAACAHFAEVESLYREIEPDIKYAYSFAGIFHAETLLRAAPSPASEEEAGVEMARRITEANLEICEQERWPDQISMCHRVLGDIAVQVGGTSEVPPTSHYDEALRIARSISYRPALIEALLARGRYLAVCDAATARQEGLDHLNEALGYALQGGYRRYEADIRNALARAYRAAGDTARAVEQAGRARALSAAMGYAWGVADAAAFTEGGVAPTDAAQSGN